jgi:hypothetical protein
VRYNNIKPVFKEVKINGLGQNEDRVKEIPQKRRPP